MDLNLTEKQVSSENVFNGVLLHVYKDIIELPNGDNSVREYIKHQGAVAVVPVTDKNEIIAVKQYRYPIGRVTVEIPAGKLDKGETPLEGAIRELSEETGITSDDITYLGGLYPSVAYTDEIIHMYMAKNLVYGTSHTDDDEFIDVVKIPIDEFVKKIMDGEILDSKTQAAVLKTARLLGIK
ncbi:MAG: NUDIX hydrolase [Clostridiales bacterium]|nr:NUDIX hydrolase [Clostridiales bacterium]